jgi:hypothetical protein
MGNNPKSQATGSRDTFGANASFDILLNHAGGAFETPGDYLYRTFIGDDVMQGMWGLMRVGEPMQDIVKVIRFEQAAAACADRRPRLRHCLGSKYGQHGYRTNGETSNYIRPTRIHRIAARKGSGRSAEWRLATASQRGHRFQPR